ncbi:metallophosphoesterase [Segetibacter sp. 3557_3]|uniref:BamA/TamA family outer membrane protein n=1 Tax=Segetibacter sp. 3557_3 TaxID=2547429 RepID=UPI001058964A|nr:BamA/TamA family outer membrane protein [Segetibacter sp. 3557_3]TDH25102.1 metallophosphoesterase [Segetibacter sp. 3557_3]
MRRAGFVAILTFLLPAIAFTQDSLQARIILIGDAGDLKNGRHPVISAVKGRTKFDEKTTVVYLGDNLYLTGLPDEQAPIYDIRRQILDTQVLIAGKSKSKVYFIPGNHDWERGHAGGYAAILREEAYINAIGNSNVQFYPGGGCGGPVEISVSNDVTMVIFDSQWWIHPFDKPGIESDCPNKTKTEVLSQLEDILARNSKKFVILACHHPFKSYGPHGGNYGLKQHIFPLTEMWPKLYVPLPVIGSIYPIARGVFGTPQDLRHPAYANMIKEVENVAKQHPNLVFVSGHEHNLQLIRDSSFTYIISGSGTKSTRVTSANKKRLPFSTSENGYAVLEVSKNKNVDVAFYTVGRDTAAYHQHLVNFATLPKSAMDTINPKAEPVITAFKDSVTVAANKKFGKASGVKRIILGNNYRKEWTTPVTLKVFNLKKEKGGLTIESLGGGKQTKSLKLVDKGGKLWTLRTINKDPERAIPENVRGTVAEEIVQDMISAANPYAPLIIPPLAKPLGIPVASPEFFLVPDDPAFGFYRPLFANQVCLLEEREPTPDSSDTKSTAKIINKLIEDNDNHVDQEKVLNARLLDMLIADWDRHFDQWRFGTSDTGKGKLYYPIPRDRDQALFDSDGLLAKQLSQNVLPFLKGFKKSIPKVSWLAWEARDFDRLFMNNLDAKKWRSVLDSFKIKISDEVIRQAVQKLPPEIYAIRGEDIIKTLISRRDDLVGEEGMRYYRFLSREVNVVGSNKHEYFKVLSTDTGVHVTVYKRKANNDTSSVMYSREFNNKDTDEILFYGLNGDDYFEVDDNVNSKIHVRIIGGRGKDTFNVKGNIKNHIYDFERAGVESNYIVNRSKVRSEISANPLNNEYDVTGYKYDIYRFPRMNVGFNPEDKLMFGVGWLNRTYGFRNEPYATQQRLSTLYAINRGSYQVNYNGEFNQLLGKGDLVVNASIVHPVLNNFFGLGNDTKNTREIDYYRVRYNFVEADLLYRKRLGNLIQLTAGGTVYNYWIDPKQNVGKILQEPGIVGLDPARVYSTKTYVGGKLGLTINNLNSDLLPTRGIYWKSDYLSSYGVNNNSKNIQRLTSDLTLFSSLTDPAKVVAVIRGGGGIIFGNNYEYFQALNLGANNFLRGYRKNRFSGTSMLYQSTELRVKLFESQSYVLPGAVGIIGFNDVGKVWVKNQQSTKWHHSYGGGLYYSPYNLILVSATLGISEESVLFNFSIGTRFNITF